MFGEFRGTNHGVAFPASEPESRKLLMTHRTFDKYLDGLVPITRKAEWFNGLHDPDPLETSDRVSESKLADVIEVRRSTAATPDRECPYTAFLRLVRLIRLQLHDEALPKIVPREW